MKRIIFVFLVSFFISQFCFSQDIILLKNGDSIRSKIMEVGESEVKYKKFDNQNGPVYLSAKSDISQIYYENGTKDTFSSEQLNIGTPKENPISETVVETAKVTPSPVAENKSKFLIGFNLVLPTGIWPPTALSNAGTTSFLAGQGHPVKSLGFGILIQMKIAKNISLFLDGNTYNYNIL